MYRRIASVSLIVMLLISLLLSSGAAAQGPAPEDSDPAWQATYWNNMTLAGDPAVQVSEANLDHNWGGRGAACRDPGRPVLCSLDSLS